MSTTRRAAGLLLYWLLVPAGGAEAQQAPGEEREHPAWVGDLTLLSANGLIGGITAGARQALAGGSFQDGFTRGFLGGGVVYAGKRLAAARFPGSGLMGREAAAVGGSIVVNAAEGRPSLSRLVIPVGPVRLHVEREGRLRVQPRLDLAAILWTGYALTLRELELDPALSLSSGAVVFRAPDRVLVAGDSAHAGGRTFPGVVLVSDLPGIDLPEALAHERVHVLQYDQIFLSWTLPLERRLLRELPGGERFGRYVDPNASELVFRGLSALFREYEERPWEMEAFHLAAP